MDTSYRRDYTELELPETADWDHARASYRGLVNRWHPDRYTDKPKERAHAQARFIRLTRAFDSLRQHYREHGRMPYEVVVIDDPATLHERRVSEEIAAADERVARAPTGNAQDVDDDFFSSRQEKKRPASGMSPRRLLWAGLAATLVVGTLGVGLMLDRYQSRKTFEAGRDALRQATPSEFMPGSKEVRSQSSRGAFVERPNGKIGDQLMPNVFH